MIEIHRAKEKDIAEIVSIHQRAFPDFFLTSLGAAFLRLYYGTVLKNEDGILLVAKVDGKKIVGFCAGTILSSGFNTRLIKENILKYVGEGLKLLFSHPIKIWHLYKNLSKENPKVGDDGEYAELLSIGVDPNEQGGGAGKRLLMALEEEVKKGGGSKLSLTTDYENNEKALGFYHSIGYNEWYEFVTFPNRKMYRMIKNINYEDEG